MSVLVFLALAALVFAPPARAAEIPGGFQSVPWTATLEQFQSAYPYARCLPAKRAVISDVSCLVNPIQIAGAQGDVLLSFYNNPADAKAAGLGVYSFRFKPVDFSRVRAAFVERFGNPQNEENVEVKTGGGLSLTNSTLTWDWPEVTAILNRYASRADQSSLIVQTKANFEEFRARLEAERKGGAKDF